MKEPSRATHTFERHFPWLQETANSLRPQVQSHQMKTTKHTDFKLSLKSSLCVYSNGPLMHLLCGKSTSLEAISNINTAAAAINVGLASSLLPFMVVFCHNKSEDFFSRLLILNISYPFKIVKVFRFQQLHQIYLNIFFTLENDPKYQRTSFFWYGIFQSYLGSHFELTCFHLNISMHF